MGEERFLPNTTAPQRAEIRNMQYLRDQLQQADSEKRRETRGMKKGGSVSSASKRADGCAIRGKTRGKTV